MLRDSSIGADTDSYEALFSWVRHFELNDVMDSDSSFWFFADSDPLYRFYNAIIGLIFDDPHVITTANSLIIIVSLAILVDHQSADPWLSALLFLCLGLYQLSLNLAPSFMASLIVLAALPFAQQRRLGRFLACVLLGAVFHPAALVMACLYPLVQVRLTALRFWSLMAIGLLCATVGYSFLLLALNTFLPSQYMMYLGGAELDLEKLAVWLLQFLLFLFCYCVQPDKQSMFEKQRMGLWLFLLESAMYFLTMQSSGLNRAAFLFMPYIVVLIPNMLSSVSPGWLNGATTERKALDERYIMRHANLAKTIVIVFALAGYIARMSINNIGQTMPYEFIF